MNFPSLSWKKKKILFIVLELVTGNLCECELGEFFFVCVCVCMWFSFKKNDLYDIFEKERF